MDVRYVWIDSLCIIQEGNGGTDWLREALRMAEVYVNAFCNVSADWGTDSQGLFFDRDPREFEIPCLDMTVDVEGERIMESFAPIDGPGGGFWNVQVTHSPLNTRAWVLQERLLSIRNLHFCPQEVLYECCETAACERYPKGLPPPEFVGDAPLPKIFEPSETNQYVKSLAERWGNSRMAAGNTIDLWPDIVTEYTRCHLTYSSDKLVAISGIARFFQRLKNDRYITGLWERSLAADMAWHRVWVNLRVPDSQRNSPTALNGFRRDQAPSFSWASVNYPVVAGNPLSQGILPKVSCFKYRTKAGDPLVPIDQNLFGPLSGPVVEVRVVGSLKQARLRKQADRIYGIPFTDCGDVTLWPVNLDDVTDKAKFERETTVFYYIPWQIDEASDVPSFVAIFFELVDEQMARFRRIGIMRSDQTRLEELYMRTQDGESTLPCDAYDAATGLHTVYVI
ncbi:hypothetical protein F4808DRAFT_464663 [Astrocystis sublimbata]|nr:hypothetical protein F4808DRAFT_464663 [Astrocystis sublimbata]